MKLNCKGFVLLETLIVAVFIVGIFTFLYSSVLPLLGVYEDLTAKADIDVVYKLYHLRKALYEDSNLETIVSSNYRLINCDDFANKNYCNNLISSKFIDLEEYELLFVKNIKNQSIKNQLNNLSISDELKEYINNYKDNVSKVILLYDKKSNSIAHLFLNEIS